MLLRLLTGVVCCLLCRDVARSWYSHQWLHRTVHHDTIPPGSRPHWPPWSVPGDRREEGRAPGAPVQRPAHRGKGTPLMAMTAMVKDELSRVECTKTSERKAEVTALLRFSGGLHIVGGRVVIEAELDTGSVARRLRRDISEVYGYTSGVSVLAGGNIRRGVRYLVRIAKHGEGLARQTGLVDQRG